MLKHTAAVRRVSLLLTVGTCLVAAMLCEVAWSADVATEISAIKAIRRESANGATAAAALKRLSSESVASLMTVIKSISVENPLAANYLRGAAESIAERELAKGGKLPAEQLEALVTDTSADVAGRQTAYDLLVRVDTGAAARLVPGFINDPNPDFRREAVALVIVAANAAKEAGKADDAKTEFQKAMAAARDEDQVDACKAELEKLGEKVDLHKHFGLLTSWSLVGPFDNTDTAGLNVVYPPEEKIDLAAEYVGKDGAKLAWKSYATEDAYGIVDLNAAMTNFKSSVTYATTTFTAKESRNLELRLGTPNAYKVWVNGELVFSRGEYHRGEKLDQYRLPVKLKAGENRILLKVCQNDQKEQWAQKWQFQIRVCDATGTAVLPAAAVAAAQQQTSPGSGGNQ